MNIGFGISKLFTANITPSEIVFFDTADPNTGGTVFDPNTPAQADTLYVSSVDASTWIYSGGSYVGYTAPTTSSTPFYLWGTTIDAGSNKTASISRFGQISVTNALGYLSGYSQIYQYGFRSFNNISTSLAFGTSSDTPSSSVKTRVLRTRGLRTAPTNVQSGDVINDLTESSLSDEVYREYTEATENHSAGTSTGVKKIFQSTKNGSATLEDRMEFTGDGTVKIHKQQANVQSVVSSATVTPNADTDDEVVITAQAEALTIANPSGTSTQGQPLLIRIKDDATARAITFGSEYRAIGVTLPTTTTISKTLYIGCVYNSTDSKWDVLGINLEA